ncbi:PAS domain-containing sensor histidine kinase [Ideonella azotifigens]|uniref:histidine kinase n=1 Tax=Ideonella azotifigens TaxID=513160 RepID=A0ABP3V438_9BURK|nr:PAS domain-containing sensor histidine kinase [Ideonella azotifigens]MCD2341029.1 PAS domain-containing sensor histidine kinase [Ideonella azotifigens]
MSDDFSADANYHMRLLVDRVPSMLAYWDRDLRCRFSNRAYERWFGVSPDRLLGTSIRDLLGPKLFAMNEPHIQAALAGERQVFERIVPGPGGVQRHSLAEYIPDLVGDEVRGFLVQVTEVTQLKETQAALRREEQLRGQVEAHAAELDALLRERTEMLDVLAHEVRQPLNNASAALQSAKGALSVMGDLFVSDQLVRAQAVLGQVLTCIDNTLAVASLLARPEPIQCDDTDIDTLIAVVVADMHEAERSRILVQRDTTTRTALMDMSLMRLALRNVVSNALKFSPPGTPVQIRIADSDEPLALVIDVCDSGAGIHPEQLPGLFARGARGRNANAGHGLGLYIVRQVMSMHGGSVEILSTGDAGTTLRLLVDQTGNGA